MVKIARSPEAVEELFESKNFDAACLYEPVDDDEERAGIEEGDLEQGQGINTDGLMTAQFKEEIALEGVSHANQSRRLDPTPKVAVGPAAFGPKLA